MIRNNEIIAAINKLHMCSCSNRYTGVIYKNYTSMKPLPDKIPENFSAIHLRKEYPPVQDLKSKDRKIYKHNCTRIFVWK
jgi:hypothetical protein